ncbi:uncharacterized protein LOC101234956 [Hydra vulgaris]|uniref:uncharacterized protein LOC101234956 n=1 Tax=Hydra vulgaris TaxID=6087 RepID=UPI001F5F70B3|nr:uncharacterized protein LOC101234956 [Hydra vulgaris]
MLSMWKNWTHCKILLLATGKRKWETSSASCFPRQLTALPICSVHVNTYAGKALVDSGCTRTIISKKMAQNSGVCVKRNEFMVLAVNGELVKTVGDVEMVLMLLLVWILLIVVEECTYTMEKLNFVSIHTEKQFVDIKDKDFDANFDGMKWTAKYKWKQDEPQLKNFVTQYKVKPKLIHQFNEEMDLWVENGWLKACKIGENNKKGIVPLMAVKQKNKGKIQPVLDFCKLNQYVNSHNASSDACDETLKRWRRIGDKFALLDLRCAYMQIHIDPVLWKNQRVVLHLQRDAIPSYTTRIWVKFCTKDYVVNLRQKPEECDGAQVLDLQIFTNDKKVLCWKRGNIIPKSEDIENEKVTRRRLFSICGHLIGHYPIGNWLRIACSFTKRYSQGDAWDDLIGDQAQSWLVEILCRLEASDPVKGTWNADGIQNRAILWCDASSIAMGVAIEYNRVIVEDAAWLRSTNDVMHINMAELDAVVRGINLAVKWDIKNLSIFIDSVTVHKWLKNVLTESHRVRSNGLSEMLIKRRLSLLRDLIKEYSMNIIVKWVPSSKNKADVLTRVSKKWLNEISRKNVKELCGVNIADEIRKCHSKHHFGVNQTMFTIQQRIPQVSRKCRDSVRKCR